MGIKSINQTVKLYAPGAFVSRSLSDFRGTRIAIDGNEKAYAATATICRKMISIMPDPLVPLDRGTIVKSVANALLSFSIQLMERNITPVWCWDGVAPPEKEYIRNKRKQSKDKLRIRIASARKEVESTNIFARTPQVVENYKKLLAQDTTVTGEEMMQLKKIMFEFGIPSIQAPNEGEKLASALAREGLVSATWTTDTDTYLLGAPIMITDFEGYHGDTVSTVNIPTMLKELTASFRWDEVGVNFGLDSLIDLGIMHGTDFNPNIRLVGPVKATTHMQNYGSIEQIGINNPKLDISVLNYVRTREIFQYEASNYKHDSPELNIRKEVDVLGPMEEYDCLDCSPAFINSRTIVTSKPNCCLIIFYPTVTGPSPSPIEEKKEIQPLSVPKDRPSDLPTFG
jgi:flap endonuclease-1